MKNINIVIVFLFCFCTMQYAQAGNFSGYQSIGELKVDQANLIRIKAESGSLWVDDGQCNGSSQASQVYLDLSNEAGKAMYSLVLSAKVANQPIAFWLDGCKKLWDVNIPIVVSAYIN
ncbi:hypothetical protein C9J03_00975 [Photobacterium gaetbulicola]|uniref:Uncharacterized protein n=1 Tax=Photobacterium gaetbulicola Gung47 TaxID=658445 RepID=A0A0C5WHS4_9GAMM|nr:hypothetical protein [Photobacterium gaetbulicola]AJR05712.1 hypothetical protein H744_1c0687 [Photobacterium gaetbulicola Gung47]PSU14682.1 hypothetical protein C9J03_00975 [Photobacterium gaetbulicola]